MYIQTNLTKIICTVQVLASIGNLCQQPGHDADMESTRTIRHSAGVASVGVTPRIFPTFTIAQKQEELELSVLQ